MEGLLKRSCPELLPQSQTYLERVQTKMYTLQEMAEKLKQIEETTLLEILGLSSEDLVDRCMDLIEDDPEKYELALAQFFDQEDEDVFREDS